MPATSVRQGTVLVTALILLLCTTVFWVHVQQPKPTNRMTVVVSNIQHTIARHIDPLYSADQSTFSSTNNIVDEVDEDERDDDEDEEFQLTFKEPSTPPESLPSDPYAHYIYQQKLTVSHGSSAKHSKRRTIVIGDLHGNLEGLNRFLKLIDHDPRKDVLILSGDMVTRGPQSIEVIDTARKLGIKCVRGNHEDKVIRWRGYLDSLSLQEREIFEAGGVVKGEGNSSNDDRKEQDEENHPNAPADLNRQSEHYHLARKLTKAQYHYLRSCPLIYTVPKTLSVHGVPVHIIHAGIDPKHSILKQQPWVLINIRNLLADGTPMRKKSDGQGWSDVFNNMHHHRDKKDDYMVVYGHDAGRGLNIKRRSVGIDTGCVYGRQLTGYVVETGEILSVPCPRVAPE